jgi:hypothetical protein
MYMYSTQREHYMECRSQMSDAFSWQTFSTTSVTRNCDREAEYRKCQRCWIIQSRRLHVHVDENTSCLQKCPSADRAQQVSSQCWYASAGQDPTSTVTRNSHRVILKRNIWVLFRDAMQNRTDYWHAVRTYVYMYMNKKCTSHMDW